MTTSQENCHIENKEDYNANETQKIPKNVIEDILKVIKDENGSISLGYALQLACQRSEVVKEYFKDEKLVARDSRKVRNLFVEINRHQNIKVVKKKPELVVKWIEKEEVISQQLNTLQSGVDGLQHSRNELLDDNYAAIDTEYIQTNNPKKPFDLIAVAFVNSQGIIKAKHVSDFNRYPKPEQALVEWTMTEILKYRLTIGWYSKGVRLQNKETGTFSGKDSDLKVIDSVCKYYDIPSIIEFDKRGVPYVRGYHYGLENDYYLQQNKFDCYYHIDLYNVYKKPLVKSIIYNNRYKDLSLESVSQAILKEGKFENLKGSDILNVSKEKLMQYVTQDANLVMKLSKHNNYEILDLMNAISVITELPFDRVCHTSLSTWWTNIIKRKVGESKQQLLHKEKLYRWICYRTYKRILSTTSICSRCKVTISNYDDKSQY